MKSAGLNMKKEEEKDGNMNKRGMLANLIGAFVVILIGVSLIPIVSDQVSKVAEQNPEFNNSTAWSGTMLKLIPAFFAIAILGVGITMVASALRSAGLLGGRSADDLSEPTAEEIKVAKKKKDEEERQREFVYKPNYKSPECEYEGESQGKPVMDATVYETKKKAYDDKMKLFNKKKVLTDKDLEKNL